MSNRCWMIGLTALLAISATVTGQSSSGSITGTVVDATGAVTPGASVIAKNPRINSSTQTKTDETGVFLFAQLPPAIYEISIEKAGFKTTVKKDVVLITGDHLNAGSFQLEVGATSDSISVTAEAGTLQLQTESGERSNVITPTVLKDIALNGRNVFDLFKIMPGVVANPSAANAGLSGTSRFNVNGTRSGMTDFSIDGATSKNTGDMATAGVSINPDAIAEVRVVTSNYQAEYGRAGGANIQLISKSGTNDLHASARYFRRHDSMNANSFFNNQYADRPRGRYRYNYTGYDIGGPVVVPHLFDGRNKLFFFWNQEYYQQSLPQSRSNFWTPTSLERAGDFSKSTDGNGNPVTIRDPRGSGVLPGNKVPANQIYAAGASAMNFFPQPNFQGDYTYNYTSEASNSYPRREDIIRLDTRIGSNTSISGHYIHNYDDNRQPYGPPFSGWPWPLSIGTYSQPGHNVAATVTHTFSPTLINETTYTHQELHVNIKPGDDNVSRANTKISTPLLFPDANRLDASPSLVFGGIANLSSPYLTTGYPFLQSMPMTNYSDNLTKVRGSHTLKAGIFIHMGTETTTKTVNAQTQSRIDFSTNSANPMDSGNPFSNALYGVYNGYSQSATWVEPSMKYHNIEWYLQDSWKVRRGLVLDFGMRFVMAPAENDDKYAMPFYQDLWNRANAPRLYTPIRLGDGTRRVVDPAAVPATPTAANTLPISYANLVIPGTGNISNGTVRPSGALVDTPKVLFAPRFGFAYSPAGNDKTVIRGGFGISYDRTRTSVFGSSTVNPPNGILTTLQYGWLQDIEGIRSQGLTAGPPLIDGAYPRSMSLPSVMSYSLGVQRNVGAGMVLDVAYVANLQRHLAQVSDLNATPYGLMFTRQAQDPSQYAGNVVPAVEPGLPAAYAQAGLSFTGRYALATNLRRPYPGLGTINYRTFDGSANYNSLQISLNRRFSRSLTMGAAYTYSKTLGTAWDDHSGSVNPFDTRAHEYRLAPFDRTQVFALNYVYNLPDFGTKLSGNRVVRTALNGWQISGLTTASTGTPFELGTSISGAGGWAITGSDSLAPMMLRKANAAEPTNGMHINPDAYTVPGLGSLGYGPRQYLRNPGFCNHDLSVFKNFRYSQVEGRFLQLRLEMFNAPNHTNFTGINSGTNITAPDGSTGLAAFNSDPSTLKVTNNLRPAGSTRVLGTYFGEYNGALSPRIIQLGVKVYF